MPCSIAETGTDAPAARQSGRWRVSASSPSAEAAANLCHIGLRFPFFVPFVSFVSFVSFVPFVPFVSFVDFVCCEGTALTRARQRGVRDPGLTIPTPRLHNGHSDS